MSALCQAVLPGLRETEKQRISDDIQAYALYDLYFFSKYIMGYWWLCNEPHREFCHEIQRDRHLTLYLLPRGHCKTKIFSVADTIRNIIKHPEEPIGVGSDIQKRAEKRVREIRFHYENNSVFKSIFYDRVWENPYNRTKVPKWANDELFLPGFKSASEASITAFGIESMPTGSHYPRIKFDDLVVPENTTTAEQIKKVKESYGLVRSSILTTYGNAQICGTIYDDGDLHREMEDSGQYHIYKRSAEWHEKGEGGELIRRTLWPVQYGPSKLDAIKRDPMVSVYIYSCQYLLDPAPEDENAFFQLSWFPRYKSLPRPLQHFAAADLAISEKESAADTAIVVGGLDWQYELYLIEVVFGHFDSLQIVDAIIDIQARHKPGVFTIEAENIQRTLMPFLKLKMRETGIFPNIEAVLPKGDKIAKARPLQGRAKEGAIWLPSKDANQPVWLFDTEFQLRRFPRAKRKDITDSLALLCHQLAKQWKPRVRGEQLQAASGYQPLDPVAGY